MKSVRIGVERGGRGGGEKEQRLVRDCSSWPRLDDCLRVTVGTPDENDAFLTAIADIFSRIGATA